MVKRGKKAQFYIMAAVIISGIIIAFAVSLNVSEKRDFNELYELGEELKIESQEVMDHGIYLTEEEEGIQGLLEDFTRIYTRYKGHKKDLYFVFGNKSRITVAGHIDSDSGTSEEDVLRTINVWTDKEDNLGSLEIDTDTEGDYVYREYPLHLTPEKIIIEVDDIEYPFNIKGNQFFYFVINKKIDGQHYIISNQQND